MDNKLIQFTWAYTKYKYDSSTPKLGDGVFNKTIGSESINELEIVQTFWQKLPHGSPNLKVFGFTYYQGIPLVFNATNRFDLGGISNSRGISEYYITQVSIGSQLLEVGNLIDYYKSTNNNFMVSNIDDSKTPTPYPQLQIDDIIKSKGHFFNSIRFFQVNNLEKIALLIDAIFDSYNSDKVIYLVTNEKNNETMVRFLASGLKLLPTKITNLLPFITFTTSPQTLSSKFKICGVISDYCNDIEQLSLKGYVFDCQNDFACLNNENGVPNSKFGDFIRNLKPELFEKWVKGWNDLNDRGAITEEKFYQLIDNFKFVNEKNQPTSEKIQLYLNMIDEQGELDLEMTRIMIDQINQDKSMIYDDPNLGRLTLSLATKVINEFEIDKDLSLDLFKIILELLFNQKTGLELQRRCVDCLTMSFEQFFKKSYEQITNWFKKPEQIGLIENSLKILVKKSHFDDDYVIYGAILRIFFYQGVFNVQGSLYNIISICARQMVILNQTKKMIDLCFEIRNDSYRVFKFLINLTSSDGGISFVEDLTRGNSNYLALLIEKLVDLDEEQQIESFIEESNNLRVCKKLIDYCFAKTPQSLEDIDNIFKQRFIYAAKKSLFDTKLVEIFDRNLETIVKKELANFANLDSTELQNKYQLAQELITALTNYDRNELFAKYLIILNKIFTEISLLKDSQVIKDNIKPMRIDYEILKMHQLSPKKIKQVFKLFKIEPIKQSTNKKNRAEFYQEASNHLRAFLNTSTNNSSEARKKSEICSYISKIIIKEKISFSFVKDTKKIVFNIILSIVFSYIVAMGSGALSYLIFNTNNFFMTQFLVISFVSFIISQIMFWYNSNLLKLSDRVITTSLETIFAITLLVLLYFGGISIFHQINPF